MESIEDSLARGLIQAVEWAMLAPGLDPYSLLMAEQALQDYLVVADPSNPLADDARRCLKMIAEGP